MASDNLKNALTKAMMPEYDIIVDDDEKHDFSPEFEQKMERLISRRNKPYYHMINTVKKRAVCAAVSILFASSVTILSVKAFRISFFNFVVNTYEKFSKVEFVENTKVPSTIENIYGITYDLSDFEVYYEYKDATLYNVIYTKEDTFIYFSQFTKDYSFSTNTEGAEISKIYINGHEAMYFLDNHNYYNIIWCTGEYIISLGSNIGKNELISIAESVQKVE